MSANEHVNPSIDSAVVAAILSFHTLFFLPSGPLGNDMFVLT